MQPYDNLSPRITVTAPWSLSRGSPRPFACCLPRLSAHDNICPRKSGKRKIRAVWTVSMLHILACACEPGAIFKKRTQAVAIPINQTALQFAHCRCCYHVNAETLNKTALSTVHALLILFKLFLRVYKMYCRNVNHTNVFKCTRIGKGRSFY